MKTKIMAMNIEKVFFNIVLINLKSIKLYEFKVWIYYCTITKKLFLITEIVKINIEKPKNQNLGVKLGHRKYEFIIIKYKIQFVTIIS